MQKEDTYLYQVEKQFLLLVYNSEVEVKTAILNFLGEFVHKQK